MAAADVGRAGVVAAFTIWIGANPLSRTRAASRVAVSALRNAPTCTHQAPFADGVAAAAVSVFAAGAVEAVASPLGAGALDAGVEPFGAGAPFGAASPLAVAFAIGALDAGTGFDAEPDVAGAASA
ncbi:MAG TPA: hypothetical protein VNN07_19615, partial [Candidatus Tectomicrobia bacterium]|nr:hypothetical protein [Candidatus Tectomicrobia bacterium]